MAVSSPPNCPKSVSTIFEDPEFCETGGGSWSEEGIQPPSAGESPSPPPVARATKTSKPRKSKAIANDKMKKPKKSDIQKLHSNSQRLVRESSVNLPKYQPKPRSLDGFLTKLRRTAPPANPKQTSPPPPAINKENRSLSEECALASSGAGAPATASFSGSDTTEHSKASENSDGGSTAHENESNQQQINSETPCIPLAAAEPTNEEKSEPISAPKPRIAVHSHESKHQQTIDSLFPHSVPPPVAPEHDPDPAQPSHAITPPSASPSSSSSPSSQESKPALPLPVVNLCSVDEYLFANDESVSVTPPRPLAGVDLLQHRFTQHVKKSKRSKVEEVKQEIAEKEMETEGDEKKGGSGGVAPIISSDVVEELMDQPGAVRKHWKKVMSQRLSRQRAEERQAAEEVRRMYNEEEVADGGVVSDEEEAELTDADTTDMDSSDEEFVVGADEQRKAEESDHCSDFSDDDNSRDLPTDQLTDGEGADSNDDEDDDMNTIHRTKRSQVGAFRRLESDDEDSTPAEAAVTSTTTSSSSSAKHTATDLSLFSLFGKNPSKAKEGESVAVPESEKASRRFSVLAEEASMGPLLLNESFSDSETSTSVSSAMPDIPQFKKPGLPGVSGMATLQPEDSCLTIFDSVLPQESASAIMDSGLAISQSEDSGLATAQPGKNSVATVQLGDSGLATQEPLEHQCADDLLPDTVPMEEEEEEEEETGYPADDSLESSSIQCGQSAAALPPVQPRKDSSDLFSSSISTHKESDELESQWLPQSSRSPEPSQSLEEETQFLDANGFLCIRKEKKHNSPVSAIHNVLDPSQSSSPSELLALCSGQFVARQDEEEEGESTTDSRERRRHLSDSSSTQGVRELLGLPLKPKPTSGISKLMAASFNPSLSLNFDETQNSEVDNVLELCSGVFPPTQQQPLTAGGPNAANSNSHFRLPSFPKQINEGEDTTSDSEEEDSEQRFIESGRTASKGEAAILRWAARKQEMLGVRQSGYVTDSDDDEDMPILKKKRAKLRHKPTKGERLAEYVESEAELSGEDVGPDEEDHALIEDEYEEEEEGSDVPLSDSELWDQVNRAHMKEVSADDRANLKDLKERFLKEGDLYEDGLYLKNGFFRTRKFAHQTGSDAGSLDLFGGEEGGEGGEGGEVGEGGDAILNSQAEAKRRKERVEREEFIRKCRAQESSLLELHDEDSQSILGIINDTTTSHSLLSAPQASSSATIDQEDTPPPPAPLARTRSLLSQQKTRRGSFLRRNSGTLHRLSSVTTAAAAGSDGSSATPSVAAASSTSRSFVFHKTTDPTPSGKSGLAKSSLAGASKTCSKGGKPKARKLPQPSSQQPLSKKPKLDRSASMPTNSIFSILN